MAMENSAICVFFKYGYCKFKTSCKNKHVTQVCDDEACSQTKCQKRHPRPCRFFSNYGTCKLGNVCAYKHGKNNELEKLEKKMNDVLKISMEKDDLIKDLVQDVKKLIKKNEEKDDIIKGLIKEVKELKEKAMEKEEDVEQEETTGREDVDEFVRASKNSLKLLDSMETDFKRSRKIEVMKKKFKDHKNKIDKEVYSSGERCEEAVPPQLADIVQVWMDDWKFDSSNDKDYKENVYAVIKKCREEFNKFLSDPVKFTDWFSLPKM